MGAHGRARTLPKTVLTEEALQTTWSCLPGQREMGALLQMDARFHSLEPPFRPPSPSNCYHPCEHHSYCSSQLDGSSAAQVPLQGTVGALHRMKFLAKTANASGTPSVQREPRGH